MQTALDLAAYALGATLLVGVLLLGMFAYDVWWSGRFRTPYPTSPRLPCLALEGAREVYGRMKAAYAKAPAQERRHLDVHLRRMGERVRYVEHKTFSEQDPYYRAVTRREKLWRGWKALHAQVRQMSRPDRKRSQYLLDEAAAGFRRVDEAVKELWERGVYRDKLVHEELRALGLLDEDYLPKLLEQMRVHSAHSRAEAEDLGWREPGGESILESSVEPGMAGEPVANDTVHTEILRNGASAGETLQVPAEATDLADIAGEPSTGPAPSIVSDPRPGIGRLGYDRIRAILAPLFRGNPSSETVSPAPATADAQASPDGWRPAPPPPRVEPSPVQQGGRAMVVGTTLVGTSEIGTKGAVSASAAAHHGTAEQARTAELAILRQQDVQGTGLAAPGRHYGDPTFSVAGLPRGILRRADLSGGFFAGARFTGRHRHLDCRFTGADLSRIVLEAQGRAHQFVRCDFSGARFDGSRLQFALFHECDLSGSRWNGARLERVRFSECNLTGVEWGGVDLIETRILGGTHSSPPARPVTDAGLGGPESNVTVPGDNMPKVAAPAEFPGAPALPAQAPASSAPAAPISSTPLDVPHPPTPPVGTPH